MMPQPDAETARQIEELAASIAELTAKRDAAEKRARELLAAVPGFPGSLSDGYQLFRQDGPHDLRLDRFAGRPSGRGDIAA